MFTEYENLKFTNSFMFCNILQRDPELCKELVEAILDVKIREIICSNDEESIKPSSDGHGVRLDVYLEGDDAIYDIEMQTSDTGNLRKRSRYYQSVLDTDFLKAGQDYGKLKKTYVIFICTFDLFGKGLPKYTFSNVCKEFPGMELGDEATKVFLNAKGALKDASPALCEFLKYIINEEVSGKLSGKIDENLRKALKNERIKAQYMTFEWELQAKYREGMEAERRESIKKMLAKLLPEEIIELGFEKEDVEAALAEAKE